MTRTEVFDKLKEIFYMSVSNPSEITVDITEESELNADLGMTSINMLYTVIAVEESFGIRFEDVGLADFKTVGDIIDYIIGKLK